MHQRFKVIALTVAAVFICYIDRVVISLAIIPMSEEAGWSETQKGIILGSFYMGLYHEKNGDIRKAIQIYRSAYTLLDVEGLTKDELLERADLINQDLQY